MSAESDSSIAWEAAYLRFETPEDEIRKFKRRLRALRIDELDHHARVLEIFCGRGNGMHALQQLGFARVAGVDLSVGLLSLYGGPARRIAADCTAFPFRPGMHDLIVVQGGLHHLHRIPSDLERVLSEVAFSLREGGIFVVVEPWLTPFLRFVHWVCRSRMARRLSQKVDALAEMIEHEGSTYQHWLSSSEVILGSFSRFFAPRKIRIAWGKLTLLGVPRQPQ